MNNKATVAKRGYLSQILEMLIITVVCFIPFIVGVKIVNLFNTEYYNYWNGDLRTLEYFSFFKFCALLIVMLVFFVSIVSASKKEKDHLIQMTYKGKNELLLILVFTAMVVVSYFNSNVKYIALWGAPDRWEGTLTWLMYIVIFFIGYYYNTKKGISSIFKGIVVSSSIMSVIGILQFFNFNIFSYEPLKFLLIIPGVSEEVNFLHNVAFGTLFNPNYVGSYCVLILPILFFCRESLNKYWKSATYIAIVLTLFFLKASGSLAGLVGLAGEVVIYMIILLLVKQNKTKIINIKSISIVVLFCILIIPGAVFFANSVHFFGQPSVDTYKKESYLKKFEILDDTTGSVQINNTEVSLKYFKVEDTIRFYNSNNEELKYEMINKNVFKMKDPKYSNVDGVFYKAPIDRVMVRVIIDEKIVHFRIIDGKLFLADNMGNAYKDQVVEAYGFSGFEHLGSGRGYIWSRSLPLLKNTMFIGKGADTYFTLFPRNDFYGKAYSLYDHAIIVDKAHSLYLQMALQFGCLSVMSFLLFNLLAMKKAASVLLKFGSQKIIIGLTLAISGYLITGMFNDSTINVAPIYWILMGLLYGFCASKDYEG